MDIEIKKKYPHLRKYGLWGMLAVGLLVGVIWSIIENRTSVNRVDSSAILSDDVIEAPFEDFIRLQGKVETATVVRISSTETGIVEEICAEEGAMVNAGDIILVLANPNLRQQILDSESQLAEKQNMLRDTELAMQKEALLLKRDILSAKTEVARTARMAKQQQNLYDEKLTPREDFLKAQEDYALALENYNLLEGRLWQDSAYRSVQVALMRESLENMRENFELVRRRADNLKIKASHSGQLGSVNAVLGQNISAGEQVGQINILDSYKITMNIDEHYIDRVEVGQPAVVRRNGYEIQMRINKVYPEVVNGSFRADLEFSDGVDQNLRVGQNLPVELMLGETTMAIMVPKGAFFQTTAGQWIYVVASDGKSAGRRPIRIGRQNPRYYEVLEGLAPGEKVITGSYSAFGDVDKLIF